MDVGLLVGGYFMVSADLSRVSKMKFVVSHQLIFVVCVLGLLISGASGNIRGRRGLEPVTPTELSGNNNEVLPDQTVAPSPFTWKFGSWSKCKIQEENKCGRTRTVSCIFTSTDQDIPFHFCDLEKRPNSFESCDVCKEDCVLTVWSLWSECSATCAPATRYRTRQVVRRPDHGGKECQELSQIEACDELEECQIEVVVPTYTWKIQEWTSCRQVSFVYSVVYAYLLFCLWRLCFFPPKVDTI